MERLYKWRLVRSGANLPFYNMALDEAIFLSSGHCLPTLRFYTWSPPALSIGYSQKIRVVKDALAGRFTIVRRPTGGEAVFHSGDLSYSIVFTPDNKEMLLRLNRALAEAVGEVSGIKAELGGYVEDKKRGVFCYETLSKYDIIRKGDTSIFLRDKAFRPGLCKLGGASFRKRRGVILQQGFISLRKNLFVSFSLESILARKISPDEVAAAIISGFEENLSFSFEEVAITAEELNLAKELMDRKYKDLEWTERF